MNKDDIVCTIFAMVVVDVVDVVAGVIVQFK